MKKRILVVDDDAFTREMLNLILENAGYEVLLAEDGHEAVRKARALQPDLVLIDGLLPGLHGFKACKSIKEDMPQQKVVLLTGIYTKPHYRWEARENYGADDVLYKPVKANDLLCCIERHLANQAELPPVAPQAEPSVERQLEYV